MKLPPNSEIAQHLLNRPLALAPTAAHSVLSIFASPRSLRTGTASRADTRAGYALVAGVAIIAVGGILVQKSCDLGDLFPVTGYDAIRCALLGAIEDGSVRAIVLDVDSHGGAIAGLFDLCDCIAAARRQKPIWAILSETAYSAAYAIASACSRVTVPKTGGTGSIGIIAMHVDMSAALSAAGLKVSVVTYGARKADFDETKPLSREARSRAQAEVDELGEMLDVLVARNRRIPQRRIKAMQAATFMGLDGVRAGLADAVMAPDEAFRSLVRALRQ